MAPVCTTPAVYFTMLVALLVALSLLLPDAAPTPAFRSNPPVRDPSLPLFASASDVRAARLDTFTVFDVRSAGDYRRGHVPGAVRVSWLDYRDGWGRTGRLQRDLDRLAERMEALGVDSTCAVIVYGEGADGWGEEGRIAWMLRYLGHSRVAVLDGGIGAWTRAGGAMTRAVVPASPGRFHAKLRANERASADDVASAEAFGAVVLDTRSLDEWQGSRRYWPARTGRIPGAVHLEWSSLLGHDGTLDRSPAMLTRLRAIGLAPDRPVLTYCVGGVRSAFVALALREFGFSDVRNYDGSWYEWAADRTRPVEQPR